MSATLMPSSLILNAANSVSSPFIETGFASTGFILISSALVFLMTPGVGFLYSGLSHSNNVLTVIVLSYLSYAIVTIQWILFGFSFAYSDTGSAFWGDFQFAGFANVGLNALTMTAPQIPIIAFALYQLQFATVTVAIIFGAVTERVRIIPALLFIFVWTTYAWNNNSIVYDPVCYWTWAARGWIRNLSCVSSVLSAAGPCGVGAIDFAGGGPVHIASGFSGLAYAIMIGKRQFRNEESSKPHNVTIVYLATALLWFGWFGFNGASAIGATPRAAMAAFVTTGKTFLILAAASAGGLAWVLVDKMRGKKISGIGFCTGAIAGLVGITPGSGYVAPWASLIIGVITSIGCNASSYLKKFMPFDDSLDSCALHGVGGVIGNLLAGIFAQKWVALLDGSVINGGLIDGNPVQLGYQIVATLAISTYSFLVSIGILFIIGLIPGFHLRSSNTDEEVGGDVAELGEVAYSWMPAKVPREDSNKAIIPRSSNAMDEEKDMNRISVLVVE